jgi:16S rRNA processing protein RimM
MGRTSGSTSSTEGATRSRREPDSAADAVTVGRVVGAHGLDGRLRVRLLGGDPGNLRHVPRLWLGQQEGDTGAVEYEVAGVGPGRPGEVRLALVGIDDRDTAEAQRGRSVLVSPGDLPGLPEGEYYVYELVGCRVEDAAGREIGTVRGIWETGAPDVLVVEDTDGAEHLIPAAEALLLEVDVEGRRVVVDAIPGLVDEPERR